MVATHNELVQGEWTQVTAKIMADRHPKEKPTQHQMSSIPTDDQIQPQPLSPADSMHVSDSTKASEVAEQDPPSVDDLTIPQIEPPLLVTPRERLGERPAYIDCPFCESTTQTRVKQEDSTTTKYVT